MDSKTLTIVIAPMIYRNNILLMQRTKQPFLHLWGMPGGKIDFGEHIEDAVQREILEETGLRITPQKLLAVISEVFFDEEIKESYWHAIIYLFSVKIKNPNNVKQSKEGELCWFDLDNLPKDQIIPSDYEMIKKIVLKNYRRTEIYSVRMIKKDETFTIDYFIKK